jgi:hypothetical protein
MNCIGPTTPEDFELLAYADGEASSRVAAHLSACASCQSRLAELRREEASWQDALYRAGCPPPLQLGEHYLNLLPTERSARVSEHLKYCRACEAEARTLAEFLDRVRDPQVFETIAGVRAKLRTIVAQLRDPGSLSFPGALAPAPRAVRDVRGPYPASSLGGSLPPLAYEAEDFLVTVEFWQERPGRQSRQVVGFIAGPDDFAGAEVEVTDGAEGQQVAPVDESGNFVVEGVAPGPHRLLVKLPTSGVEVLIDNLAVA